VAGIKRTKKIRMQVISDEITELNLRFKNRYTGLKIPVTTMARTITDRKGHSSQPNMIQDTVKTARKNHKIIARGFLSFTMPPISIGIADFASLLRRSCYEGRIVADGYDGSIGMVACPGAIKLEITIGSSYPEHNISET
jgi:hypothetical protein